MVNTFIKNAFRIIPMIPLVYHLLWFSWNGNCYFDMFLSLNASSSIFFSNLVQLYNRLLYQDTARGECLIFKTISVLFFHQIHNNDLSSSLSLCENTSTPPPLVLIVLR